MPFLSLPTHHGEPGDPVLLAWINDQIDAVLGLSDFALVVALGAIIVAIPIGILAFFIMQRAWDAVK